MARPVISSDEEIQRARQLRDQATTISDYRKALSVILVAEHGLNSEKTAEILGASRRTVFRDRKEIRNQDASSKRSWGGRRRCSMTIEQEQDFLDQWEDKATEGGVLSVLPIHASLIERLGHNIPLSTTYRLLARHGWRKVHPDTKHPKSDPVRQDEFKKKSLKLWLPPA